MGEPLTMDTAPTPAPTARRFAVVGSPIAHSLSPVLHRAAYRGLGDEDATYDRHEVAAGGLEEFVQEGPGRALHGLSVTMPGKPEAFALAAESDEVSARLRISNTLIRRADGRWRAENHDVHGIASSLRDHGALAPSTGAVLGSGATALSAVAALIELGAGQILLTARSPDKLVPLEELAAAAGVRTVRVDWDSSWRLLEAEAVISALATEGAESVARTWTDRSDLPRPGAFLDVLYDPWPAPLAKVVAERSGEVADGLEMLAHQADLQVRSMLGVDSAPVAQMLAAARQALADRS